MPMLFLLQKFLSVADTKFFSPGSRCGNRVFFRFCFLKGRSMTEQKIPDGSVDIVENVRKLETFLDRLLDGYGYEDPDGNLEVFNDQQISELEQGLLDGVPFDRSCVAERSFSDWLAEQLSIDVCFVKTVDLQRDRFHSLQTVYRVSGWSIDITCGGPSVYLRRDPFSAVSYTHLTLPTKRIV